MIRWNYVFDKAAALVIGLAGVAVICSLAGMLVLMLAEVYPLFIPASMRLEASASLPPDVNPAEVAGLGVTADLHLQDKLATAILLNGDFAVAGVLGGVPVSPERRRLPGAPDGADVAYFDCVDSLGFSVLWSDLTLSRYGWRDGDGGLSGDLAPEYLFSVKLDPGPGRPLSAMLRGNEERFTAVAVYADGEIREVRLRPARGLGLNRQGTFAARSVNLPLPPGMAVLSQTLNQSGRQLYLGTTRGELISVEFPDGDDEPAWDITPAFRDRRPITTLSFLNGGYAVAMGDAGGGVSVWFPRREGGEFRLRPSVSWDREGAPPRRFAASGRDRSFFGLDDSGGLAWLYSTTGERMLESPPRPPVARELAISRRGDLLLLLRSDGGLEFNRLDVSYPEAGWRGYFQRLLYEGYEKPAFVWQSSGSDDSEPKLSLLPLIWGSIKGALYSLFFAAPLALAAAMYLSQFARPAWRAVLKPAVEVLAAVPSVVVGFLAALWLAPLLEKLVAPLAAGHPYDQRNSLVIALAMGFAVIPIVFSLAEDAISAVPTSLSVASLALGATRWQTVWRVVLPSASPGIFTAVLLGFGRAVGETMIVLMAAGNTPIISLSPFNGMRTLSANIAVEMPEAPVGGVLYRTLFLCALALFAMTLIINAAAEVMRVRLRRRYGSH